MQVQHAYAAGARGVPADLFKFPFLHLFLLVEYIPK